MSRDFRLDRALVDESKRRGAGVLTKWHDENLSAAAIAGHRVDIRALK